MTTITNLVVALMIVTQGEAPVKGCALVTDDVAHGIWWDKIETLYRKTAETNFVYSATIHTPLRYPCDVRGCRGHHDYTAAELFGCPVVKFYTATKVSPLCPAHAKKEDGAK